MIKEEFKLDNQLCFRLYTASRLLTQAYHPLLSEYGLTYPQYLVLLVLWEKDAQPVNGTTSPSGCSWKRTRSLPCSSGWKKKASLSAGKAKRMPVK